MVGSRFESEVEGMSMRLRWNSKDISIAVKEAKHTEGQVSVHLNSMHSSVLSISIYVDLTISNYRIRK